MHQARLLVGSSWRLEVLQRQTRVVLRLLVTGLGNLLDGPDQRLNGTFQVFRVHLVPFDAVKVGGAISQVSFGQRAQRHDR